MRISRIFAGYVLACIAFGVVIAAFVFTPADIATSEAPLERLSTAGFQALLSGIQVAVFAGLPTLVGAVIAEWRAIGSRLYYVAVAIAIALLGFFAQYASELQGQPTIVNGYALAAFVTGGLAGGLVYWLIAGRRPSTPHAITSAQSASVTGKQA